MPNSETERSKKQILIKIIEYVPNSLVTRNIIRRTADNVSVIAIDTGLAMDKKICPFDTFLQIIEGNAEVVLNEKSIVLNTGEGIVIPANNSYNMKAGRRFKMISTIIQNDYETSMPL